MAESSEHGSSNPVPPGPVESQTSETSVAKPTAASLLAGAEHGVPVLPRIRIEFCTQCRWMLRAAYFAQELLSTFGTMIGEIALVPGLGGVFRVDLTYVPVRPDAGNNPGKIEARSVILWDRKSEGGFPETKVLKQRVRDHLDPERDLGHSDKGGKKKSGEAAGAISSAVDATSTTAIEESGLYQIPPQASETQPCQDCDR